MQQIEAANEQALGIMLNANPVLKDVVRAGDAIPELDAGKLILHAGPPVDWGKHVRADAGCRCRHRGVRRLGIRSG